MEKIVVSYWCGELPKITELHFRSFLKFRDGFTYILYLDKSTKIHSAIPTNLKWISDSDYIQIKYFDFDELLQKWDVPLFNQSKLPSPLDQSGRFLYSFWAKAVKCMLSLGNLSNRLNFGWFNSELGWFPSHHQVFSRLSDHLTYRSDLFRSVIMQEYSDVDFLYVDLDICFMRNLGLLDSLGAFTSQWGTSDFANTAFLYLPSSAKETRSSILSLLHRGRPAWPWSLYGKAECKKYDLAIEPIVKFDPVWTPGSLLEHDASLFFKNGPHVNVALKEIRTNCMVVHWHNQWKIDPEDDSVYMRLLKSL